MGDQAYQIHRHVHRILQADNRSSSISIVMTLHHPLPVIAEEICQLLPISLKAIDRYSTRHIQCIRGIRHCFKGTHQWTPLKIEGLLRHQKRPLWNTTMDMP